MTMTEARPALETGWEPSTPATDTLMRRFVLNHADYVDAVVSAGGGRCRLVPTARLTPHRAPSTRSRRHHP